MNSNWSYSPETVKLGCDLCDLDLWPWPFAWTSLLSLVITPENLMMIRWREHSQKGVTDRQTDGRTENNICRAAWSQLKTIGSIPFIPGIYPYGVSLLTPLHLRVPSLIFSPLVAKKMAENGVSGTFWKKLLAQIIFSWRIPTCVAGLQNRNLYWIFLDEVGSDQSGSILSPFMGTACFYGSLAILWNCWIASDLRHKYEQTAL